MNLFSLKTINCICMFGGTKGGEVKTGSRLFGDSNAFS